MLKRDYEIEFSLAAGEFIKEERLPNLAYLCLYGSQNYNLDTPQSDIDIKGFAYPTIEDIAKCRTFASNCKEYKIGTGIASIMDIREFARQLKNSNINSLEYLFSPYFMYADNFLSAADVFMRELKSYRNEIVECNPEGLYRSAEGLYCSNINRAFNPDYPKPHRALAKCMRATNFMEAFNKSHDFEVSLKSTSVFSKEFILTIKSGENKEWFETIQTTCLSAISKIPAGFGITSNKNAQNTIDELSYTMVKNLFSK